MLVTSQVIELSVLVRWLDIIAPGRREGKAKGASFGFGGSGPGAGGRGWHCSLLVDRKQSPWLQVLALLA